MKCSICQNEIQAVGDWTQGNNAEPVNDGRCCEHCNATVVIPARLTQMRQPRKMEVEMDNDERAERALIALAAYAAHKKQYDDTRTTIIDLTTDLMHLAEQAGFDAKQMMRMSEDHYSAESQCYE
jgi:hypothetical protein